MRRIGILLAVFVPAAFSLCAAGQEQQTAPEAAETRTPPAATPAPARAAGTEDEQAGGDKAAESGDTGDDEFIPSEEIAPDEEVIFPVDI